MCDLHEVTDRVRERIIRVVTVVLVLKSETSFPPTFTEEENQDEDRRKKHIAQIKNLEPGSNNLFICLECF